MTGLALAGCESRQSTVEEHARTIDRYCVECHSDAERAGGLTLQSHELASLPQDAEIWEKVVRKLRAGMMPPEGPTPDRNALASFLEQELDRAVDENPNPGRSVPFHRLNRSEYANAVRDLFAVDLDVSELLPSDDSSFGFDNIGGVLKISPTLLERYLTASEHVTRVAVGLPAPVANINWFRVPDDRSQERQLPEMPFGTRGGTRVEYAFPVDADYEIAADLQRNLNESVPLYAEEQHLEIAIDGKRVGVFTLEGVPVREKKAAEAAESEAVAAAKLVQTEETADADLRVSREQRAARDRVDEGWRIRVPVSAGEHVVTATFLNRTSALEETLRLPFARPYPSGVNISETRAGAYLRSMEISGPYDTVSSGHSASRERVLVCKPEGDDAVSDANLHCAEQILAKVARRAYRRDVSKADVAPLLGFYRARAAEQGFDAGLQLALKALLVAPEFLFRIERDPEGAAPSKPYAVGNFELASRLSFFLWSSIPDEELLDAASSGRLSDPATLDEQVRRMLADEKASAFTSNFPGQWLFLRNLDAAVPVQNNFPDFDDTLRQGLRHETELFFDSIVREDRSALELLTADYTFVNGRVAQHYGIDGIKGPHFRRVTLAPDSHRRGLLGQGSILTVTSYPDRTSPVVRGKWILENLLGAPPPAPPPDVPGLVETNGEGVKLTMRERLAKHRANPICSSCHALMDPLGFSLENFDAVGQWRTVGEAGEPVDAMGGMPDGTQFEGVEGLRNALLSSDLFVMTLTEKLMTYALGRGVEAYDMPTVRRIAREAAAADYRFSAFITSVVKSDAFRMRMPAHGEEG